MALLAVVGVNIFLALRIVWVTSEELSRQAPVALPARLRAAATDTCHNVGRLIFCRGSTRTTETRDSKPMLEKVQDVPGNTETFKFQNVIVEVVVKDRNLAAKFADGSLAEYLTLLGPISRRIFDEEGLRTVDVALPQLGLWAQWSLREKRLLDCGEGGMTWAMGVVLANYLGAGPEYPRLRVLELGTGTGLVSLALAGRGHSVVATDGDDCVLENLRWNIHSSPIAGVDRISTSLLRWEVDSDRDAVSAKGPFDVIVGADLIYDEARCDALGMTFRRILSSSAEVILVERDRVQRATACAATLQERGWSVDVLPAPADLASAVVDGIVNPRSLRLGGVSPLILRITRGTRVNVGLDAG